MFDSIITEENVENIIKNCELLLYLKQKPNYYDTIIQYYDTVIYNLSES